MTQKCLKALSLMAIESELTKTLDFDDIMDDFAQSRARKKCIAQDKTIIMINLD